MDKVLIVEDNSLNQLFYFEAISELGFKVDIAPGVELAKDKVSKNNYRYILCDYKLQDGNGIELFNEVVKNDFPKNNFFLVSGLDYDEIKKNHPDVSVPVLLQKPLDFDLLKEKLLSKKSELNLNVSLNKIKALFNNDEEKIRNSVNEYFQILVNANQLVDNCNGNYETLRGIFHDVLNLCQYFEGKELFNLIFQFKGTTDDQVKFNLLNSIRMHIKGQCDFLKSTGYVDKQSC